MRGTLVAPATFLALVLTLSLLPSAAAAPQLLILHDVRDDGTTHVDNLDRFGFALTDDGTPQFHQDVRFTITQNDRVLIDVTEPAGHDYDGVGSFALRFLEPGPYTVQATWNDQTETFTGMVLPANGGTATIDLETTDALAADEALDATYRILDANGERLDHVDILVQVLDADGREVLRTQTHSHVEDQSIHFVPTSTGSHTLRLTGFTAFPGADTYHFPATTIEHPFTVAAPAQNPLALAPDPAALLADGPQARQTNRVVEGTNGPLRLIGTYDPFDAVGPGQAIRLNALVVDANGTAVPHVDFEAKLTGPDGNILFQSDTLHEYDALLEFVHRQTTLGTYRLEVLAERGDWTDTIVLDHKVLASPASPQPTLVTTVADADGCDPRTIDITATRSGTAYAHSEIIYTTLRDGQVMGDGKLHTHNTGTFTLDIGGLPTGSYDLELDNQATTNQNTGPATGTLVPFSVADCVMTQAVTVESVEQAPLPALPLVLAIAALALVLSRRTQ